MKKKKKYYIVEWNLYIKDKPMSTAWLEEDGIEIHARGDVWFNEGPGSISEDDKATCQVLEIENLGHRVSDVIAYSTKSYFEGELVNS